MSESHVRHLYPNPIAASYEQAILRDLSIDSVTLAKQEKLWYSIRDLDELAQKCVLLHLRHVFPHKFTIRDMGKTKTRNIEMKIVWEENKRPVIEPPQKQRTTSYFDSILASSEEWDELQRIKVEYQQTQQQRQRSTRTTSSRGQRHSNLRYGSQSSSSQSSSSYSSQSHSSQSHSSQSHSSQSHSSSQQERYPSQYYPRKNLERC